MADAPDADPGLEWSTAWRAFRHVGRHPFVFLGVLLGVVGVFLGVATSKKPSYRAVATMILEKDRHQEVLFDGANDKTTAEEIAAAMAILTSRTVAERVTSSPGPLAPRIPMGDQVPLNLDLTARVFDESLSPRGDPMGLLWGADNGRVRMHVRTEEVSPGAPRVVRLRFDHGGMLRVGIPRDVFGVLPRTSDEVELPWRSGMKIQYRGLELRIEFEGDPSGQSFLVEHLGGRASVDDLVRRTTIKERARGSGVIEIMVDDVDPERAAATANAIHGNFLALQRTRRLERAGKSRAYIRTELERSKLDLQRAERQVSELQALHPEAMDLGTMTEALILQLRDQELRRIRLGILEAAYSDALEALEDEDFSAVSRLGEHLDDPVAASYVKQIGSLIAEFWNADRLNDNDYRNKLHELRTAASMRVNEARSRVRSVGEVIDGLERGDESVLAQVYYIGEPSTALQSDSLISTLLENAAHLRGEYARLQSIALPDHPNYEATVDRMHALRNQMLEFMKGRLEGLVRDQKEAEDWLEIQESLIAEYPVHERGVISDAVADLYLKAKDSFTQRLDAVRKESGAVLVEIAGLERRLSALPEKERVLAEPLRRREALRESVQFLESKNQAIRVLESDAQVVAQFFDPAIPPAQRRSPRLGLTLIFGLVFGLFFACSASVAVDAALGRIYSESDLEHVTGLPNLASIPAGAPRTTIFGGEPRPFLALRDDPSGSLAESYRALRAGLRGAKGPDEELRSIAVISSGGNEGRAETNVGLAMALANEGRRVLLVDGDLREPSLHGLFGVPNDTGLAEALDGRAHWRQCSKPTGYSNLDLLTAGDTYYSPGDLFSGLAMDEALAELRGSYDRIVFDLPGVASFPDVESLAHKLDALVFLHRPDAGPGTRGVRRSLDRIRGRGGRLIGAVRNLGSRGILRPITLPSLRRSA